MIRFRSFSLSLALMALLSGLPAAVSAAQMPESFADQVEKLSPAVVNIATTQKVKQGGLPFAPFMDMPPEQMPEEFRDFFEQFQQQFGGRGSGRQTEKEVTSLGSGFVIDPAGFVVTNNHVIAGAEKIRVIFQDDTKLDAKIVGRDAKTDLAVLKVESTKPLASVTFGDSDKVRVGDWVIAIGNPFGLGGTVTAGIISARARNINSGPFDDFLQTDAAINRGNSGGPMFNTAGEVIGINTAIFSPSGGNIGIGFAVPSSLAKPVIDQLRQFGKAQRGWLGVKIQEVTDEMAESLGLGKARGALVMDVTENSPAGKAGVQTGDIILSFDGHEIGKMRQLPRQVAETKSGKKVSVEVWRGGKTRELSLTLGEMSDSDEADKESGDARPIPKDERVLGFALEPLTPKLREKLKLPKNTKGVVITDIDENSEAARRGFRPGDVIAQVNDRPVATAADVRAAIAEARKSRRGFAMLRIVRQNEMLFVTVPTGG